MYTYHVLQSTTSENAISPTSPPSSPAFPHQCLLCYVAFPDLVSLRQHCKSALHVNTLLRDCGASTIWKHFPPPPGPPQLQFCPKCVRTYMYMYMYKVWIQAVCGFCCAKRGFLLCTTTQINTKFTLSIVQCTFTTSNM